MGYRALRPSQVSSQVPPGKSQSRPRPPLSAPHDHLRPGMAPADLRSLTALPAVASGGRRGPSEQQQQQRPRHCRRHRRAPGPGPSPAHGSALGPALPGPRPLPPAPAAARAATAATAVPAAAAAARGSHSPGRSRQPAPGALPPARPRPTRSRLESGARGSDLGAPGPQSLGCGGKEIRRRRRAGVDVGKGVDSGLGAERGAP